VCCSALQCVAVCCSVLQCVASIHCAIIEFIYACICFLLRNMGFLFAENKACFCEHLRTVPAGYMALLRMFFNCVHCKHSVYNAHFVRR